MKKIKSQQLYVFFEDLIIGTLKRDSNLIYSFSYSKKWLDYPNKFQLSLAMPFQEQAFGNRVTLSFFENLLPEGETRDSIEKNQHVKGVFDFLNKFGMDCAGAIIITEKSIPSFNKKKSIEFKIDKNKIYQSIEQKKSIANVIADMEPGYLSIAGAQDKFAAIVKEKDFYLPVEGQPTTHIIKIPIQRSGIKESVYNELYCMKLAKRIGLNVSECFIIDHDKYPLYITERYDRMSDSSGTIKRLHQQDFCQAQGIISEKKYEEKGGPTLKDNYELIKNNVSIKHRVSSLFNYLDWISFNLLIGNNDSHSKNLSFVLVDHKIVLAPFYDLMCTAIYPKLNKNFSYKIGNRSESSQIGKKQFEMVDMELGLKVGTMLERVLLIRNKLLEHKDTLAKEIKGEYPNAKIVLRISELIKDRCISLNRQGL